MKKIEASTLAEAYQKAAEELECSITELNYEVIQHPSSGVLGMFKKSAIIVAECQHKSNVVESIDKQIETIVAEEIIEEVLISTDTEVKSVIHEEERVEDLVTPDSTPQRVKHTLDENLTQRDDVVLDSFFETKDTEIEELIPEQRPENNNLELAEKIEAQLVELLSHSCFAIDTVEVDVVDDTALIFIDGDDAALLIGKEGYRYNALSYLLFNWLHTKYDLYIKLEIAQFLTTQQEMIRNYIKPVIEHVTINGRGKTRPLDGILVQIALEQLREAFPNKYVAIKTGRDGRKFVILNEFNNRNNV